MAVAYKNIVITPNISNTAEPTIAFSGANSSTNVDLKLRVLPDDGGILDFEKSDNTALFTISTNNKITIANSVALIANGSPGGSGDILASNATGVYWKTLSDLNTTYDLSALSTTGGANVRLTDSNNSNDDVKFTGTGSITVTASGSTITIDGTDNNTTYTVDSASNTTSANVILVPSSGANSQIKIVGSGATSVSSDGDTITITSTDTDTNTTYDLSALATTGGANVRLSDSSNSNDDIKFTGTGSISVTVSGNTITIDGTDNNTTYTVDSAANTTSANVILVPSSGANSQVKIVGSGATSVSSDGDTITISSTDNDTTYSQSVVSGTGYANVRLTSSGNANDDVKFQGQGGIVVVQNDSDTVNVAINAAASYTWSNDHTFNANLTANDVVINGNLTVSGTTTYVNSVTLNVGDNIVTLNADIGANPPSQDAGIEIHRGTSANASLLWNETSDVWQTYDGSNYISLKAGDSTIVANSSGIFANASAIDTNTTYTVDSAANTTSANVILVPSTGANSQVKIVGSGATSVSSDGDTITISSTDTDTNTTYAISALSTTGGANVRLTDSSNSNDDVKFTGSGSVTVSVVGDVITISGTDTDTNTTYDQLVVAGAAWANLRLHASTDANDDVKLVGSGTVSVARTDDDTITITGSATSAAGLDTEIQYNSSGSFAANSQFTFGSATPILTVGNTASTLNPTIKVVNSSLSSVLTSSSLNVGNSTVNTVINQTNAAFFTNATTTALYVASNGNVGVATASPTYNLQVNGSFAAVTKSFLIDHPVKKGYKLRYGSLESPYHGIRLTGSGEIKNGKVKIDLPSYVKKLVREEDSQVQLTNFKHGKILWVDEINIDKNNFVVKMDREKGDKEVYKFFWSFTAIRIDIEDMIVEFKDE